jgi:predicted ribosomally synthesized peptide with nif11-like leader
MSIESAKAFLEKIQSDEEFKNKIGAMESKEERIEFIKGKGFDFTEEEFSQVRKELSPEALDQAAGGAHCGFTHEGEKDRCPCFGRSHGHFAGQE